MSFPVVNQPFLPPNTIVPDDEDLFIAYLNKLYEDIAYAVNNKDTIYFPIAITNTATNITNVPNFGSYIICISGANIVYPATDSGLPCLVACLCKSSNASAGTIAVLSSQVGTLAPWVGASLTVTSTATNYQIKHSVAATTGNFNIRFIGTQ